MLEHIAAINNKVLTPEASALSGAAFISRLLQILVTLGLIAGALIFVFMLLLGGLKWISSAGDKAQLESAKSTVTNALIGIIVLFSIFAIIVVVEIIFRVNILNINIDNLRIQ